MRRLKTSRMLFAVVAATALAGVGAGPSGLVATAATYPGELTSSAPVTVVASGLNNPRSLAWGPGGHLLVSEAGTYPSVCSGTECFGLTGSISDISSGTPVRIVTGLATYVSFGLVVGTSGLTYVQDHLYTLVGHTPLETVPPGLPRDLSKALRQQLGALLDVTGGSISVVANPGDVNYEWSQEHMDLWPDYRDYPDSNPYALTPKPGGGFYVVDAAANTLDSVDQRGKVRVLAYIPNTPAGSDAVPTCLDMGPDGAVYIGQLTGRDSSATAANVYRYEPWSGELTVWQSGFSTITGCGFGANGDFYVTEYDTTGFPPTGNPDGVVIQISKEDGTRTVLGAGQLFAPAGFLAGPDGSIYVANNTIFPGTGSPTGEVVKIG
jgi:hypothetical protein